DTNDINDPIDAALSDAGKRLRREAPDVIASRQALERMNERAVEPTPARKSWWPTLIGAGLAAAAIIGVIAIRADDNGTPTVTPVTEPTSTSTPIPATSIEPTTTPVPTTAGPGASGASVLVDAGCITVTTAAGSATGCPLGDEDLDHLEQRVFVADLDGPVLITSGSADPLTDLTATVDTGNFASNCRWDDLAPRIPDGDIIELVVCNDTGVMGLTMPAGAFGDTEASYFTLPTPYLPDGADLGLGAPIDGLPRALAFTAPVQDITTCSILLLPDRTGWKEACGFIHGLELDSALALIDPRAQGEIALPSTPYEIAVDDQGLITSARALEAMAPSSGCSIDSATQLLQAVDTSSIVMGLGCIGDKAAFTTGSVLTQAGSPDGSIWTALRENGTWAITDSGTGIETSLSLPIVPVDIWSTWPESTQPGFQQYWWDPIIAIPTQPTVDAFADELLATLGTLATDPEFPLNQRIVDLEPGGLPLIVAQVDLGGDDSVAGAVFYVWLDEQFDESGPIGWRSTVILVGNVCARSGSAGRDICV
ncbi:MAG TPA: hypothetical protein VES40_02950, partial [Ilumatobacteraceae bacterium]|nr:hypothetical protein [Ilumatobacteraceae bacterium]